MTKTRAGWAGLALGLVALWTLAAGGSGGSVLARQQPFALQPNDHISIIGNTLAERMQYDGWLETMLQARFPKHELVVRNLGFSGDEINTRPRSKNFGTPDEWLSGLAQPIGGYEDNRFAGTNTKADVVFAFFGYNESYAGAGRARGLQEGPGRAGSRTRSRRNTTAGPRRASCSSRRSRTRISAIPICPTARRTTSAWRSTPRRWPRSRSAGNVTFVDLFTPTHEALRRHQGAAHDAGRPPQQRRQPADRAGHRPHALRRLAEASGGPARPSCGRRSSTRTSTGSMRYRVTDGYSTYGDRAFLTFVRGNPRNVNAEPDGQASPRKTSCRATTTSCSASCPSSTR